MKVIYGRCARGVGLGGTTPVMGHVWWYWVPAVGWMDRPMAGGRMRGLQMRWLCFFCDICQFTKDSGL